MWGYTRDRGLGWREVLTPAVTVWAVAAVYALGLRHPIWQWPRPGIADRWFVLAAAVTTGVGASTVAHRLVASFVADLWLGRRFRRLLSPLLERRRTRWEKAHKLAVDHEHEPCGTGHAADRNRIALARPRSPTWMGDRSVALETRIRGEYDLDLAAAWPRLWLVLPEPSRADLRAAALEWQDAVAWGAWAVLYALLALAWWPLVLLALLSWSWGWDGHGARWPSPLISSRRRWISTCRSSPGSCCRCPASRSSTPLSDG
ncbi:hypothetical protein ACFQ9X_15850 [Catenulispora yoronensis]